jgi:hypothetical protein
MRARLLIAVLVLPLAVPTPAQAVETYISGEGSTLSLQAPSLQGDAVHVSGEIHMDWWSFSRYDQSPFDPAGYYAGSAIVSHHITDLPVAFPPDIDAGVIVELGLIDRVHPVLPPVAFSWPVSIDGRQDGRWLGAGAQGTGTPPNTEYGGWAGVCTSTVDPCDPVAIGGAAPNSAYWWLSHQQLGTKPGSTISVGEANGGVVASFAWPAAPAMGGIGALDIAEGVPDVKLQGEIRLGIAPEGTPLDEVEYTAAATLGPDTSENPRPWSGELAAPTLPGSYEVHAQTCWGLVDDLDCDHRSTQLTV